MREDFEAILAAELETLSWQPAEGVAFLQRALSVPTPSALLLERAVSYLALYYQELDDVLSAASAALDRGEPPAAVARDLLGHMEGLS